MQPRPLIHISYPIFFVLDWRFNHVVTLSRARKAEGVRNSVPQTGEGRPNTTLCAAGDVHKLAKAAQARCPIAYILDPILYKCGKLWLETTLVN